jgi:hypothetical protein
MEAVTVKLLQAALKHSRGRGSSSSTQHCPGAQPSRNTTTARAAAGAAAAAAGAVVLLPKHLPPAQ